jgi:hypothetical protein
MDGKLEFGCDYLSIMLKLIIMNGNEGYVDPVTWAAARLFLQKWGFSMKESDDTNTLFWERYKSQKLDPELGTVIDRVSDHIKDDDGAKKRFIADITAIIGMDMKVTEDEQNLLVYFRDLLDLQPAEFSDSTNKGGHVAIALKSFGDGYMDFWKSTGIS